MSDGRSLIVAPVCIALVALCLWACQQTNSTSTGTEAEGSLDVTVRVKGLKDSSGQLIALLFTGPNGFPEDGEAADRTHVLSKIPPEPPVEMQFNDLKKGTYAITVLHDENGDGQMNRSLLGLPQEGYGMSMNPPVSAGAPSFRDAAFTLKDHRSLTVNMIYLERRQENEDG